LAIEGAFVLYAQSEISIHFSSTKPKLKSQKSINKIRRRPGGSVQFISWGAKRRLADEEGSQSLEDLVAEEPGVSNWRAPQGPDLTLHSSSPGGVRGRLRDRGLSPFLLFVVENGRWFKRTFRGRRRVSQSALTYKFKTWLEGQVVQVQWYLLFLGKSSLRVG